jgi:membrane-associated protease RseP (regulator of RpoE activity)
LSLPHPPSEPGAERFPAREPARPDVLEQWLTRQAHGLPARQPSLWRDWGRHALLFVLTAASMYVTGGPGLAIALMAILLCHEMGHYFACLHYRVDATLPFFIPAPLINPLAGTFGAVIRIRSAFPHRRALFDIGIAGPLAGFVVCLPVLWLAVQEARFAPEDPGAFLISLQDPLLFRWAMEWLKGPTPEGMTVVIGPIGTAAWFGLFITALNLIPIGQLDGGHVVYALLRRHAVLVSRIAWWLSIVLIFFVGPSWILWSALVRLIGIRHPPTLDDYSPLGTGRVVLAIVALGVFVVCFLPNPFMGSWGDFFDALREVGWL